MFIIDDLLASPARGLMFVLRKIDEAVRQEREAQEKAAMAELTALHRELDEGAITEETNSTRASSVLLDSPRWACKRTREMTATMLAPERVIRHVARPRRGSVVPCRCARPDLASRRVPSGQPDDRARRRRFVVSRSSTAPRLGRYDLAGRAVRRCCRFRPRTAVFAAAFDASRREALSAASAHSAEPSVSRPPNIPPPAARAHARSGSATAPLAQAEAGRVRRSGGSSTAQGLIRLVLTLVKLLHDVLERQAVHRMEAGRLTDAADRERRSGAFRASGRNPQAAAPVRFLREGSLPRTRRPGRDALKGHPMSSSQSMTHSVDSTNLADLLERILDKGVVIAGDISIKLVEVELLTIQLRLVICSVDKARELGLDWWNHNGRQDALAPEQNASLLAMDERLGRIEQALGVASQAPIRAQGVRLMTKDDRADKDDVTGAAGFREDRAWPFRPFQRARRFRPAAPARPAREGRQGHRIFVRHAHDARSGRRTRSRRGEPRRAARRRRRREPSGAASKSSSPSRTCSTSRTNSCCSSNCRASSARISAASSMATSCCSRRRPANGSIARRRSSKAKSTGAPHLNCATAFSKSV